jgi:ppGpp synthetase/RelA/SpoT-type nucleotidyltranferase
LTSIYLRPRKLIPDSVRIAYQQQEPLADLLLEEIERLVKAAPKSWFFTARKKELDSFAQKIESGGISDPARLEDFVGAMIVVPMTGNVADALTFIDRFFVVEYQRPADVNITLKLASDFPFDDLRLYGHLRPRDDQPFRPIDEVVLEIQVKTFLQHAWSIATHDLVYKFDHVSWARSRVAYQVKALLEHAELSIATIQELENSGHLSSAGQPEKRQQELIDLVKAEWLPEFLPVDLRRLAMNLDRLLNGIGIDNDLGTRELLGAGLAHYRGEHPLGWSPYQCVVDYASLFAPTNLRFLLQSQSGAKPFSVFVTKEILNRLGLTLDELPFARL